MLTEDTRNKTYSDSMKAFNTDQFVLPLPTHHRFPMEKYTRLRQRIQSNSLVELCIPDAATDEQISRCHTREYLEKVKSGALSYHEIRRIGFPWSPQMVERARRSVGATIAATRSALVDSIAVNLAGGTHHACSDHGEGFCVWNDTTIAACDLQATGHVKLVLIVDCDVHQGKGTAPIAQDDPSIFTFSIHGERNFPYRKVESNLDIVLADGTRDVSYLVWSKKACGVRSSWRILILRYTSLAQTHMKRTGWAS